MNIVGQETLLNLIDSKTRDTFPRSVTLLGDRGSGKHLVTEYISKHLKLDVVNITELLNFEFINSLYLKPEPHVYMIEMNKLTIKEQNMILKFLEEPLKNAFIVLLAETKNQMLDTIVNRCQLWTLKPYSIDVLKTFTTNDMILSIARTPGVIKELEAADIRTVIELCDKIVQSIDKASIPNALTIHDKLAFKDEKDKHNVDVFADVLRHVIVTNVKESSDIRYVIAYKHINKWVNERKTPHVNQMYLFDRFILGMQQELREVCKQ